MCGLTLCACSSNQAREDEEEKSARRAAEVNTQLGTEYMSRGQFEVALEKLKRALRSDDEYAPAHTVIAVLYERIGENDLARTHYKEALDASPSNGDVNNNIGAFLCRNEPDRDVLKYFDRALEDPFYRTPEVAMANAGACALELGEEEEAERYLRRSLGYNKAFPDALFSMASLNYSRQDLLRTRAFLQRYEATGSTTPQALLLGYRMEKDVGNETRARDYRDELLQRFPASEEAEELMALRVRG